MEQPRTGLFQCDDQVRTSRLSQRNPPELAISRDACCASSEISPSVLQSLILPHIKSRPCWWFILLAADPWKVSRFSRHRTQQDFHLRKMSGHLLRVEIQNGFCFRIVLQVSRVMAFDVDVNSFDLSDPGEPATSSASSHRVVHC